MPAGARAAIALSVLVALALPVLPLPPALAGHAQADSGRVVAFHSQGGNAWWVQVRLAGQDAGSVAVVEAMDTGGPWVRLAARPEWGFGVHAASFHVEPGHQVRFRASWPGGAQQVSCWFSHPAGAEQCAAPPGFDASFAGVTGNAWWVQAQVTPNAGHTVASVEVRLDGGAWQPLKPQSWGTRMWAASYPIPEGTVVQLRAINGAGATDLSGCHRWVPPSGAPAAPAACPPEGFRASFSGVKGNAWWIEARVAADRPLAGVDARVDGGAWVAMALREWGAWAVSTHAPAGAHVQLRARAADGSVAESGAYRWPDATPVPAWPVAGASYATYRIHSHSGSPAGDVGTTYDYEARFRYTSSGWEVACEGTRRDHDEHADPADTTTPYRGSGAFAPPRWPTQVTVGQEVSGEVVGLCTLDPFGSTVDGQADHPVTVGGRNATVPTWHAYHEPCPCQAYEAEWARRGGLLVSWWFGGTGSGYRGELTATDAPIG